MMAAADLHPPAGFERHFRKSPLTDPWEPLWSIGSEGLLTIGFIVREVHCNSRGMLHGGVVAALADNAMGLACAGLAGEISGLLTASLTVDFLGTARPGDWVEVEGRAERVGGVLAHGSAVVRTAGDTIGRASAVFRVLRRDATSFPSA